MEDASLYPIWACDRPLLSGKIAGMKIIRYADRGGAVGYALQQADGAYVGIEGDIFGKFEVTRRKVEVAKVLAPVEPAQIIGIGLNYRKHAEEQGAKLPEFPIVFFKNRSAVQNPGDAIEIPRKLASEQVDYECELAVVIGKKCKNVSRENALDYVLGYCCANDVSARDWQRNGGGGQWSRGKSFDTFCPLGPCLVTRDEIPDPQKLGIRTKLNGEVMQSSNTGDMIFDVRALVAFLSGSTTLPAGTVILTGTPGGVGMWQTPPRWLKVGDEVSIEIDGIGVLTNPVKDEP
jgi:2-keto-4-pentenoate hydratase/2-oxohepta-3-ene-1,7-dioic acid hydratase in catechol pathway